jgi:hypothetical protein
MTITVPFHQFEIRYTKILNFNSTVQNTIAPFVPLALDVNVEQENTINCRYSFRFENYEIYLYWDRAIIRTDGEISHLTENNSIIEEPFFNLFNKIKKMSSFGSILNCLCISIFINHTKKNQQDIVDDFSNNYLNIENTEKVVIKPTDVCLVLEKNIEEKQLSMQFGPYLGIEDLKKRGIATKNKDVLSLLDNFGTMAEVKIFEPLRNVSFTTYKEYLKLTLSLRDKLWKI